MRRGEDGQILPGLLVILLALLAVGVLMFQVGKAAVLRSDAQTAADAAALAGAEEIKRQLIAQWATYGHDRHQPDRPRPRARPGCAEYAHEERRDAGESRGRHPGRRREGRRSPPRRSSARTRRTIDAARTRRARRRRAPGSSSSPGLARRREHRPAAGRRRRRRRRPEDLRARSGRSSPRSLGDGAPGCDDVVTLGKLPPGAGLRRLRERLLRRRPVRPRRRRLPLQVRRRGRAGRQLSAAPATSTPPRSQRSTRSSTTCATSASARSGAPPDHYNHLHVDVANSGPIGARQRRRRRRLHRPARGRAARGAADRLRRAVRPVLRLRRRRPAATSAARPTRRPRARSARVARDLGASPKVLLAAYEAAIVESGVHSLPYGDRDSIGLFQQRDSWGSLRAADGPGVGLAAVHLAAIRQNESWMSAGQLAQDVQVSAYPGALRPAPRAGDVADRDVLLG